MVGSMIKKPKIALIGAGNIGGTLAYLITLKSLGDIVLLDVTEGVAKGKALDLAQSAAVMGLSATLKGTSDYKDIADADVVIVTAGIARKPNMTRDDIALINADIIKQVAHGIKTYANNAFVIVITNPLDVMTYLMLKESDLDPRMVVGMSGVLDSSRFRHFLAEEFKISVESVSAFVLGMHNDDMLPISRYSTVSGVSIPDLIEMGLCTQDKIDAIVHRTKTGGAEIVSLLQTGSAYYAPATAAIEIAESYIKNQHKVLLCSVYLTGEYGINDACVGVPTVIGSNGVEKIIEVKLDLSETKALKQSVDKVKGMLSRL